jgi:hypothetical protein
LLDVGSTSSRQQLAAVLGDIKVMARELADSPPADEIGIALATELELHAPMERTFWMPPATFDVGDLVQHEPDDLDRFAAFRNFAALERLDWGRMRDKIRSTLARSMADVSLVDLLAEHPATNGAVELMGYLQIAHDEGHEVNSHQTHLVRVVNAEGVELAYEMPVVVFKRQRMQHAAVTGAKE